MNHKKFRLLLITCSYFQYFCRYRRVVDIKNHIDTEPGHLYNLVKKFRNMGLITVEKSGRSVYITPTKKGILLNKILDQLEKVLEMSEGGK